MPLFKPADRQKLKAKIALGGLPGVGKTTMALSLASALGENVAVIDTESEKSRLLVGDGPEEFRFAIADPFPSYHPKYLVQALEMAVAEGVDVLVIDTFSRFWNGKGGVTEIADKAGEAANFSFAGWKEATPIQNEMIEAIMKAPLHVIVTMRARIKYVLEQNDRGKVAPRKVGVGLVQRADTEFEFDFVANLDRNHAVTFDKSRFTPLHGQRIRDEGMGLAAQIATWKGIGRQIRDWLDRGVEGSGAYTLRADLVRELDETIKTCLRRGLAKQAEIKAALTKRGVLSLTALPEAEALGLLGGLHHRVHVADFEALAKKAVAAGAVAEEAIADAVRGLGGESAEDLSSEDLAGLSLKIDRAIQAAEEPDFGLGDPAEPEAPESAPADDGLGVPPDPDDIGGVNLVKREPRTPAKSR